MFINRVKFLFEMRFEHAHMVHSECIRFYVSYRNLFDKRNYNFNLQHVTEKRFLHRYWCNLNAVNFYPYVITSILSMKLCEINDSDVCHLLRVM